MHTNKDLLIKGVKYIGYTVGLMFIAPFTFWQAFKNQDHPLYIPVLILAAILAIAAIVMGFWSIKIIMDGIFGNKK